MSKKPNIHLNFSNLEQKEIQASLQSLEDNTIKIHELNLNEGNQLLELEQSRLNTLFDFSKSRDYQILYFDGNKNITGVSCATNTVKGDFLLQTQSKWVLLIPFKDSLENEIINKIVSFSLF